MSSIDALIAEMAPTGVDFVQLGTAASYSDTRVDASELDEHSFVGVDNLLPNKGGKVEATYLPNTARLTAYEPGDILLGNIRPYLKKVWLAESGGGCSGDVLALRTNPDFQIRLVPEFLYYLLSSDSFFAFNMQHAKGAKMPRGSKEAILKYRIPVPPIEVQREIVTVLDTFTVLVEELERDLEGELEARQRKYAHFRTCLLRFPNETRSVGLADAVQFVNGKPHERLVDESGDVALMTSRFISTNGRLARFVRVEDVLTPAYKDDIAVVMSDLPKGRALARAFYVSETGRYAVNQRVCILRVRDRKSLMPRFLYYVIDRNEQLLRHDNGKDQTHLKKGEILEIRIPLPSLAEQQRIVDMLDRSDVLVDDFSASVSAEMKARRQQYEYYRDRLLTFKERVA